MRFFQNCFRCCKLCQKLGQKKKNQKKNNHSRACTLDLGWIHNWISNWAGLDSQSKYPGIQGNWRFVFWYLLSLKLHSCHSEIQGKPQCSSPKCILQDPGSTLATPNITVQPCYSSCFNELPLIHWPIRLKLGKQVNASCLLRDFHTSNHPNTWHHGPISINHNAEIKEPMIIVAVCTNSGWSNSDKVNLRKKDWNSNTPSGKSGR